MMAPVSGWDIFSQQVNILSAEVSTSQKWSKVGKPVNRRQSHRHPKQIDVGVKASLYCPVIWKRNCCELMLVLIERCWHTQCITAFCVWACIVADRSEGPCCHMNSRTMKHLVLPFMWILHGHAPPALRLLQTRHTPPWKQYSLMAVAIFSRIICPATLQKWFRNGLRNTVMSLRCWLGLQSPYISIQSSICRMCLTNKFDPWRPHLKTYRTTANVPVTTAYLQRSCGVPA